MLKAGPLRRAYGSIRKNATVRGFVCQFNTFAVTGKEDGVLAHDVAAAYGVNADFVGWARADEAVAAMALVLG